jgi:hypothetical protein
MCFVWKASGKVCLILWDELKFQVGYRIFKTLSSNAPQCALFIYFFTCPTPDNFTHQWGSSAP